MIRDGSGQAPVLLELSTADVTTPSGLQSGRQRCERCCCASASPNTAARLCVFPPSALMCSMHLRPVPCFAHGSARLSCQLVYQDHHVSSTRRYIGICGRVHVSGEEVLEARDHHAQMFARHLEAWCYLIWDACTSDTPAFECMQRDETQQKRAVVCRGPDVLGHLRGSQSIRSHSARPT